VCDAGIFGGARGGCRVRHEAPVAHAPAFFRLSRRRSRALLVSSSSIDVTNGRCVITFHFVHSNRQKPICSLWCFEIDLHLNGNHSLRRRRRRGTGTGSSVSILRKRVGREESAKSFGNKSFVASERERHTHTTTTTTTTTRDGEMCFLG
jgi:hypothetical protein